MPVLVPDAEWGGYGDQGGVYLRANRAQLVAVNIMLQLYMYVPSELPIAVAPEMGFTVGLLLGGLQGDIVFSQGGRRDW